MKRLLIVLAFASIIPALHTLCNYPWHDSYLVNTIIYTFLVGACGFVFSFAVLTVFSSTPDEEPTQVTPSEPKNDVGGIICPYCQTGRTDYFVYGEEHKQEFFQRECNQCGCIYTSIRTKA